MRNVLDHLVLAAQTLAEGMEHVERVLGVRAVAGGKHGGLGTHNALLRLGAGQYLEIISIDPDAQPPSGPRWFGLDDPAVRETLAESPRLLTWVARTDSIADCLQHCDDRFGKARTMRRGDFRWRIAYARTGQLLENGLLPALIQWDVPQHPADVLPDSGCELLTLNGRHPEPESLRNALRALNLEEVLTISTPSDSSTPLTARIGTPSGVRTLGGDPLAGPDS